MTEAPSDLQDRTIMPTLKAGLHYFAFVFGAGSMLSAVRIAWLTPVLGTKDAEVMVAPVGVVAIVVAARWIVPRLTPAPTFLKRLGAGLVALALLLVAESTLMLSLRLLGIAYFPTRHPVALMVYIVMLALVAIMPLLVGRGERTGTPKGVDRRPVQPTPNDGIRVPQRASTSERASGVARVFREALLLLFAGAIASVFAWLFYPRPLAFGAAVSAGFGSVAALAMFLYWVRGGRVARAAYLAGVIALLASVFLYPFWRGVRYSPYPGSTPGLLISSNLDVERYRAPLWKPPRVWDGGAWTAPASVRWFEFPPGAFTFDMAKPGAYAALALAATAAHATIGLIALGLVFGWWYQLRAAIPRALSMHIALSMAIMLIVAWICLGVLVVASMGYILSEDEILLAVLWGGVMAGFAHGLWDFQRARRSLSTVPAMEDSDRDGVSVSGGDIRTPSASDPSTRAGTGPETARSTGSDLLWFVVGLLLACLLAALASALDVWISSYFPGAVRRSMMRSESVTHALIAGSVGVALCIAGWVWAASFWRRGWRACATGMAMGTTALGLMYLLSIPFPEGW